MSKPLRFIVALISGYMLATLVLVPIGITTPSATAGPFNGSVRHYSPDDGYDPPIKVWCKFGDPTSVEFVYEGYDSTDYCYDADQIVIRYNEELWCLIDWADQGRIWVKRFDAEGPHKIDNIWNDGVGCTLRRD